MFLSDFSFTDVIFMGNVLEDDKKTLKCHGIANNMTVYIMERAPEPLEDDSK